MLTCTIQGFLPTQETRKFVGKWEIRPAQILVSVRNPGTDTKTSCNFVLTVFFLV